MNTVQLPKYLSVLMVVSLVVVVLFGGAASAVENGGIGGKPAHPRTDNPRSESIFVYELQPGAKIEDEVQVINNTDTEKTLLLYATDSQVASGGAFSCAQQVDEAISVGSWITVAKNEVKIAPHKFENVPFTIEVPATASAGESNGCIVIQDSQRSATPASGGVTLSFRTAIRVAITIPGEIKKDLSFTGLAVRPTEKQKLLLTTGLKNNGNVSLDTDIKVKLKTIFGTNVTAAGGVFPVLARSEAAFNFEVDQPFWGGWYRVVPEAKYNSDAESSIGEQGHSKQIKGQAAVVFVRPKPLALGIELTVLAGSIGVIAWFTIRKRRLKQLHATAKLYVTKPGDTLHVIAKKTGVSWQHIVKVNNLKPPYHLEPGQRIKLPHK